MSIYENYEMIIGLEVHVELKTDTKMFCSCKNSFGEIPNSLVCPICLGHPGTLPAINVKALRSACIVGAALNSEIQKFSRFDRKNYFYPDMPKSYQITQFHYPICKGGYVSIETNETKKNIGITRIHMEEDAGKLIHKDNETLIDFNRAGVPLIEIVTEPDIRSADEAMTFLKKLRSIILYTKTSDCKMNEGSMRCDVNISVRKKGETKLNNRAEIKNINSFQFTGKAIESEFRRQVDLYEKGETVIEETRRYDMDKGITFPMRPKEKIGDYRYFPEPDLLPIKLSDEYIETVHSKVPMLPDERKAKYMSKYKISSREAEILVSDITLSDYFEKIVSFTEYPKIATAFLTGDTLDTEKELPVPKHFASICTYFGKSDINSTVAKKLMAQLFENDFDPEEKIEAEGLRQINDEEAIYCYAQEVIEANEKLVSDYLKGKVAASKAIMGQAMRLSKGKANPEKLEKIITYILKEKEKNE